jgi:hypothetical protein
MPKWRNEYRRCDNCRREYRPQRETQSYCSRACRRQAAYGRERFKAATVGRRERRLEASDKLSGSLVRRKTTNHAHRCVPHSRRILDNRAPLGLYQGLIPVAGSKCLSPKEADTPKGRSRFRASWSGLIYGGLGRAINFMAVNLEDRSGMRG